MGKVKLINDTINSAKVFLYKKNKNNKILFLILNEPEGIYGFVGGAQDEEDKSINGKNGFNARK